MIGVRGGGLALLIALLAAALAPTAEARTRSKPACPPAGAKALVRGAEAIVYRPKGGIKGDIHVCSRRTGARHDFSLWDGGDVARPFRVAGPWAAAVVASGLGGCDDSYRITVRVIHVRTGRGYEGPPIPDCHTPDWRRPPKVVDLVLRPNGSAAWIGDVDGVRTLQKFDRSGGERVDVGGRDLRALRLRGRELSWRREGVRRSYLLDRRARCGRRGSNTVARSPETRVYRLGELVYACLLRVGRHVKLGRAPSEFEYFGVNKLRLAGPFAAFDDGFSGRGGSRLLLKVVDLRSGRVTRTFGCCSGGPHAAVHAFLLTPEGAIAWTQSSTSYDNVDRYEVRAWSTTAEPVVLDEVTGPDLRPITLDGGALRWTNAGVPRSTPFP